MLLSRPSLFVCSSPGKMSYNLTSQSFSLCSGEMLLGGMEKLKKEEPSLGLIIKVMLLILESKLSSLMILVFMLDLLIIGLKILFLIMILLHMDIGRHISIHTIDLYTMT
mgnify:CR=1 FL=1